ncbi:MAG: STAS domain-containing protein, partial [Lacisediminimonas sp.]|nr:STAS domain-containing protein [Lacisediminimonas sp.]
GVLRFTWSYSRPDFVAAAGTLAGTLALGVEAGLIIGVGISLALYLYRTSKPHIAEVGLVRGTEHFRNVLRHTVVVGESVLSLRIDGNMFFANARYLEDWVNNAVASRPGLQHVVLQCSAVNEIDASALESLEAIQQRLQAAGIALHLSEVKGPVMDRLGKTEFLHHLSGKVFLSHYQAISALSPELFQPG